MAFNTRNFKNDAKMYSVVGTKVDNSVKVDDTVQNGMVGTIGNQIRDNVYELLPLAADSTDIFFVATPEVDSDESKISYNTLQGFTLAKGDVADAIESHKHAKIEISEDMVDNVPVGGALKTGFLMAVAGKRKLQYKATAPIAGDNALLVADIEDVVQATQGIFVGLNGANLAMNYRNIRARILKTL